MTLDELSRQILEVRIKAAAKRVEKAEEAVQKGTADWYEIFEAQRVLTELRSYREK